MLRWDPNSWNEDTNGDEILNQIHSDLTTQKVLLVGHSQGAFYANETYKYLTTHGLSPLSVAVYNVATPASYTAGSGEYLTSSDDTIIQELRNLRANPGFGILAAPLDSNITIAPGPDDSSGHKFSETYLAGASTRIIADVQNELATLSPTSGTDISDCFVPPDGSLAHTAGVTASDMGTTFGGALYLAGAATLNGTIAAVDSGFGAANKVASDIQTTIGGAYGLTHALSPTYEGTTFDVTNKIYGGGNETVDGQSLEELLQSGNPSQGGAVILSTLQNAPSAPVETPASQPAPAPSVPPQRLTPVPVSPGFGGSGGGTSNDLPISDTSSSDSATTSVDDATSTSPTDTASTTPSVLFTASTTAPALAVDECASSLSDDFCLIPSQTAHLSWSDIGADHYAVLINGTQATSTTGTSTELSLSDDASSTLQVVAYDASTTPQSLASNSQDVVVFTRPVIINEVAWSGTYTSQDDQWLELLNRAPYDIDLSNVALAATEGGFQYAPLSGILNGYSADFDPSHSMTIVERDSAIKGSFVPVPFDPLAQTGEQLALEWTSSAGTTTLDETPAVEACSGWCAGSEPTTEYAGALQPAPLSMERVSSSTDGTLASNWKSNDGYLRYDNDANNQPVIGSPGRVNSSHWPTTAGFLCTGDSSVLVPSDTAVLYHPASNDCLYLAGFAAGEWKPRGALLKGTVGSSTLVREVGTNVPFTSLLEDYDLDLSGATDGDQYYVAIFTYDNNNDGSYDVFYLPDMYSYLETGVDTHGTAAPPPLTYYIIPFTYSSA